MFPRCQTVEFVNYPQFYEKGTVFSHIFTQEAPEVSKGQLIFQGHPTNTGRVRFAGARKTPGSFHDDNFLPYFLGNPGGA